MIVENIAKLLRGSPLLPLPKDDYLVSAFDYMTDEVRTQFTVAGFKLDEMQYRREYRDGKFCDFEKSSHTPRIGSIYRARTPLRNKSSNNSCRSLTPPTKTHHQPNRPLSCIPRHRNKLRGKH